MAFCAFVFFTYMMFSRLIHAVVFISSSFLLSNTIPLYQFTTFYLSIHQFMTLGLFPLFGYYKWCCPKHSYARFLWIYIIISLRCIPRSGIALSCGNAWETVKLFLKVTVSCFIINSIWGLQFLHVIASTYYLSFRL